MNSRGRALLAAGAAALALAGCHTPPYRHSAVPLPANHPTSLQRELQAVQHWQMLAASIALATRAMLDAEPGMLGHPFSVMPPQPASEFSLAFHELLVTELHKAGVRVAAPPARSTAIRYAIRLVEFGQGRRTDYPFYATNDSLPPELAVADQSEISDRRVPRHELLVTTSILRGDGYWLRRGDIHYLRDEDAGLYRVDGSALADARLIDVVRTQESRRMRAEGWPAYALPAR
ncbi:MAG: hypothetical protein IT532_10180 [Burkholderiales bacterium]|nr:hypothetical protein [Burkholderiales bacterium]